MTHESASPPRASESQLSNESMWNRYFRFPFGGCDDLVKRIPITSLSAFLQKFDARIYEMEHCSHYAPLKR